MSVRGSATGFVPPPYPHDRLHGVRDIAGAAPGGLIDCSVGTPVDPLPDIAEEALVAAMGSARGYPPTIGTDEYRRAAADWVSRRFGVTVDPAALVACVGTKELVASLPRWLSLRTPGRDTVLYPGVSYPSYAMGATLAGLRAVPVPVDAEWRPDLSRVAPSDVERALLLWLNDPANPTGVTATPEALAGAVDWARARGIVVASDECYAEFTFDAEGRPAEPVTALTSGPDGVLAVHSLSKRSNMAGLRAGFVAGDADLVTYLGEVRKHAGLMVPGPIQAAAAAALGDDTHVDEQRDRYATRRRRVLPALAARDIKHVGGPSTFYLWLESPVGDGWGLAAELARLGVLVAPGDLYGDAGAGQARLALTILDHQVDDLIARLQV
ncbi:MAG TPA: aminotransferase class I/II-fold pyridoxal phosphate-dependent enzyme [Acidimicrobiia bacterium]|nr:aminotransferase class I/II-fold pyridoxal phosphate-dependent enzyme [Acidimicrobiia bacterium]